MAKMKIINPVAKAGLDNGHGGTKIYTKSLEGLFIPTVFSVIEQTPPDDLQELEDWTFDELVENLKVTYVTSHALEKSNITYYVGLSAARSGGSKQETPLFSEKHIIEHPIICGLAALALDAIKANPNNPNIEATYDLAVALPVTSMKLGKKIQEARFKGLHQLIVHQRSGNDIHITLNIDFCEAIPEAVAASFGVCYDENGNPIKRVIYNPETKEEYEVELIKQPLLHVDIGGGTTELVTTIGINYNKDKSTTLALGSKNPITKIVSEWDNTNPRKPLNTVASFNNHYYNPNSRLHIELQNFASNTLDGEAKVIGQRVLNHYNTNLLTEEQLYLIVIYGGSSDLFKKALSQTLLENDMNEYAFFEQNPMFLNARGLYVFACSPIFEKRKENALAAPKKVATVEAK